MRELTLKLPACFITEDRQRLSLTAYLFVVILCLAFFVPGIVSIPPTDRDESLFVQASKQMIETSNYVDIRIQDKPRYKKPIGIYWLQVASVKMFSPSHLNQIWAYRLPSLLGATVAVLMTAALGTLLFGPLSGFLAALMMAGCLVLNVEARMAKTDAALLGSIMLAQYTLARAYKGMCRSWGIPLLFWSAIGIGILIKGPIILLVIFSTLTVLRVIEKNLIWFRSLKPSWGVPYTLLLTVPWFAAIVMQSHGQFVHDAAGQDFLAKIWQGQNRGILPPGLHLLAMPGVFFPYSIFVLLAIPTVWAKRHMEPYRFLLAWAVPVWIVFELSLTKLPHYVLPVYPALAILSAQALVEGYSTLIEGRRSWLSGLAVVLWITVGTGLAMGVALLPNFVDNVWNNGQIIVSGIFILSQPVIVYYLIQRNIQSVFVLTTCSLIFMSLVFGDTLPRLEHVWVTRQIVQAANIFKPCAEYHLVSASYDEPSLMFMAGTETTFSPDGASVADFLKNDGCALGLVDKKHETSFLGAFSETSPQPFAVRHIEGFNLGAGRSSDLTMYLYPHVSP